MWWRLIVLLLPFNATRIKDDAMSDLQHSLSVEEVTVSLQKQHGLGDNLPTLADLPGLLKDESEQLELGHSRRLMRALIVNVNLATSHEIMRRLGDGCCVKMHQDYGTIVHPPTGDPLVPDLDRVQMINCHILDANRFTDDAGTLRKLAQRFEAKADARESGDGPGGGSVTRPTEADATAADPVAKALGIMAADPCKTVREIADAASVNRSTLYRDHRFSAARRIMREAKAGDPEARRGQMLKGTKDKEGNLDAWRE